jgi:hypothetical protein
MRCMRCASPKKPDSPSHACVSIRQVVAHKGERFLYEKVKSKNSVPEDPASFVGLKVVQKGKRGPSPKFK